MDSLYNDMGDPNGNFSRDFKMNGFHSRLFELGWFAYLAEAGFSINRSHKSPDFLAAKGNLQVALEASAASPKDGSDRDISIAKMAEWSQAEEDAQVYGEFPRRIFAVLSKKLKKEYHLLEHCKGQALVIAVAPYFESGSVFHVGEALVPCLYGGTPPRGGYKPAVPFFSIPGAESVSAVAYCNQFTVPRFLRIAEMRAGRALRALREGHALIREDGGFALVSYEFNLFRGDGPKENWAQGVTIFHNPSADVKLLSGALPGTCEYFVSGQSVLQEIGEFHPLTSFMTMY